MILNSWLGYALILTAGIRFLSSRYIYGLRRFKGPLLASFTDFWRFFYHIRNTKLPFRDVHDRYGDIVRIGPNALSFGDPQAIRDIFGAGMNWDKSDTYHVNAAVNKGKIAFTLFSSTDTAYHKNARKAINPYFTQTAVMAYEPFVERTIEIFITKMETEFVNKSGAQGIISFPTWLTYFTYDAMSDLTYSKHHGFITRGEDAYGIIKWVRPFLYYGFIVGQMPWTNLLLRHNPFLLWLERRGWYSGNTFPGATFSAERMKEREEQKPTGNEVGEREDLLDKIRRAARERPECVSEKEILGLSLSNMLAGADTTSITMTAVFYYVLSTPGCYSKLQEELDTHLPPAVSTAQATYFQTPYAQARELPYLHACVQEAMRMYPALGLLSERIVPQPGATICGNYVPGGTIVACTPWVLQRDKKTFGEDCNTYRPERWLEDAQKTRGMERAMFNFGAGNHVCLGQNIALMEIYKLVPSMMRTYEITLADPGKEWKILTGQTMKQTDFNVRLKRRSNL